MEEVLCFILIDFFFAQYEMLILRMISFVTADLPENQFEPYVSIVFVFINNLLNLTQNDIMCLHQDTHCMYIIISLLWRWWKAFIAWMRIGCIGPIGAPLYLYRSLLTKMQNDKFIASHMWCLYSWRSFNRMSFYLIGTPWLALVQNFPGQERILCSKCFSSVFLHFSTCTNTIPNCMF